jgi:hypothetical protein
LSKNTILKPGEYQYENGFTFDYLRRIEHDSVSVHIRELLLFQRRVITEAVAWLHGHHVLGGWRI